MPKIIKNQQLTDDQWVIVNEQDSTLEADFLMLPFAVYQQQAQQLIANGKRVGLWIDSDFDSEQLESICNLSEVIAINFPKFADGRGYSLARILREHCNFSGEIRAIGDVLLDQLYYMSKVGFTSFALREDKDSSKALAMLTTFTEDYQTNTLQPLPLFRRR